MRLIKLAGYAAVWFISFVLLSLLISFIQTKLRYQGGAIGAFIFAALMITLAAFIFRLLNCKGLVDTVVFIAIFLLVGYFAAYVSFFVIEFLLGTM